MIRVVSGGGSNYKDGALTSNLAYRAAEATFEDTGGQESLYEQPKECQTGRTPLLLCVHMIIIGILSWSQVFPVFACCYRAQNDAVAHSAENVYATSCFRGKSRMRCHHQPNIWEVEVFSSKARVGLISGNIILLHETRSRSNPH